MYLTGKETRGCVIKNDKRYIVFLSARILLRKTES